MADFSTELDELFGGDAVPQDDTGCLRTAVDLLPGVPLALVMVTDKDGHLEAVATAPGCEDGAARDLTTRMQQVMVGRQFAIADYDLDGAVRLAFACKLPPGNTQGLIIGLVGTDYQGDIESLKAMRPALLSWSTLAFTAVFHTRMSDESRRRIEHLLAERETLREAHNDTVAMVIEEREERIRQQREHVLHLEKEVERRSAELRNAMRAAQEANEAKSRFLANMSHEIRTPMTAILGYTDLLCESSMSESQCTDALETIKRNGQYLLELINDILDLAKVEAGKLSCEQLRSSPFDILNDVTKLMHVRAQGKGIKLLVDYEAPVPKEITTDPTRLRQILVNLVGNAIKFTEEGHVKIVVRMVQPEGENRPFLEFAVIDTGIGLTATQMANLFKPFSQGDSSTTRRYGGTGLGLTLSRRIARALGGNITVSSQYGEGSEFRVTIHPGPADSLELIDDPSILTAPRPMVNDKVGKVSLDGCSILLAEDGPDNQKLISHILRKAGASVEVAENGKLAVEAALAAVHRGAAFDVILMDMQMPVMSGYQSTAALREAGYIGTIIALTANAMAGDRQKCLDSGCDDFASKPINKAKLLEMIATSCGQLT